MDLEALKAGVLAPLTPGDLVPPPRFTTKRFDTYRTDAAIAGQVEAVTTVRRFAAHRETFLGKVFGRRGKAGLYLDGGFGVGKTHLLSSCFHAAVGAKRYLSFAEAMSLMTLLGHREAIKLLRADLVCIDEFELDDPTNTRLADLLVRGLIEQGARIITTSNTVPGELGQGRMAVDLFRNELARIEQAFTDVHVPGSDYRLTVASTGRPAGFGPAATPLPPGDAVLDVTAAGLDRLLTGIPVVNLRRLAARLTGLTVRDLVPFESPHAALRFVHFIDRCYDFEVAVRVITDADPEALFPPEFCPGSFIKKYRRCRSRLAELCA